MTRDPFTVVHAAIVATGVCKESGDIEAVAAVIESVRSLVYGSWTTTAAIASRNMSQRMRPAQRKQLSEEQLDALVAEYFTLLLSEIQSPMGRTDGPTIRRAAQQLLDEGAMSVALPIRNEPLAALGGLFPELLPSRSQWDIDLLLTGRAIERRGALEQILRDALRAGESPDRSSLFDQLAGTGAEPARLVGLALDQWAYRWYNIGAVVAALQAGKRLVVFNNPPDGPDSRTTPFCRWIHGREISSDAAAAQVLGAIEAAGLGDYEAMKKAWPMLRLRPSDGPAEFRSIVQGVTLPPYHFRCRDQVQVLA